MQVEKVTRERQLESIYAQAALNQSAAAVAAAKPAAKKLRIVNISDIADVARSDAVELVTRPTFEAGGKHFKAKTGDYLKKHEEPTPEQYSVVDTLIEEEPTPFHRLRPVGTIRQHDSSMPNLHWPRHGTRRPAREAGPERAT